MRRIPFHLLVAELGAVLLELRAAWYQAWRPVLRLVGFDDACDRHVVQLRSEAADLRARIAEEWTDITNVQ